MPNRLSTLYSYDLCCIFLFSSLCKQTNDNDRNADIWPGNRRATNVRKKKQINYVNVEVDLISTKTKLARAEVVVRQPTLVEKRAPVLSSPHTVLKIVSTRKIHMKRRRPETSKHIRDGIFYFFPQDALGGLRAYIYHTWSKLSVELHSNSRGEVGDCEHWLSNAFRPHNRR